MKRRNNNILNEQMKRDESVTRNAMTTTRERHITNEKKFYNHLIIKHCQINHNIIWKYFLKKIMILKQNSTTLHRFMWISSILWHIKIKLSFQETIFSHLIWLNRVFLFHKCI